MHLRVDFVATRLLGESMGGHATSRFVFFTSAFDYSSSQIGWICELSNTVRSVRNYPVVMTPEIQMLTKRLQETVHIQFHGRGNLDGGNWKQSQIESDLQKRVNTIIEANAQLQDTISRLKKEVNLYHKRVLDMKIQCSRMEDEMLLKDDKLLETIGELNKFKSIIAEKKGNQAAMDHKNQKMSLKIRELEWHVVRLLNKEVIVTHLEGRATKIPEIVCSNRVHQKVQRLPCQKICKQ
jgi:hypothetical protein